MPSVVDRNCSTAYKLFLLVSPTWELYPSEFRLISPTVFFLYIVALSQKKKLLSLPHSTLFFHHVHYTLFPSCLQYITSEYQIWLTFPMTYCFHFIYKSHAQYMIFWHFSSSICFSLFNLFTLSETITNLFPPSLEFCLTR